MKGHVKSAMERAREWLGKEPKWKAIEANLDPVLKFIQTLAQQSQGVARLQEWEKELVTVQQSLSQYLQIDADYF